MNDHTDGKKDWLVTGVIIHGSTTYIVTVWVSDLVLDGFALATDLALQQDELAALALTPASRVMFEENALGLRLWAEGDPKFLELGWSPWFVSPFLASRADQGNIKVVPANFEDYIQGLMGRALDAKPHSTLSFVFTEPQSGSNGPSFFVTESLEFLLRYAPSGVLCEVVSSKDMHEFYQRAIAASAGVPSGYDEESIMKEPPGQPSPRRQTPKKRT